MAFNRNSIALFLLLTSMVTFATPYSPSDPETILEKLPYSKKIYELRVLQSQNTTSLKDIEVVAKLAEDYIKLGKAESDPRFYGYAQGVLAPWWDSKDFPVQLLLYRALILQNRHAFMPALQDLQKLLLVQPANIQARLTQATILQVIGNYEEAEKSCYSLIDNQEPLVPITCFSSIMSLKGQAIKSYDLLLESINNEKNITPEQYFWSYSVLAQIASRLDRVAEADEFFNKALVAINNKDVYVLSAYADFLLAQNKAEKVINLLSANTRSDSLFLRLILAKQQLNYQDLNDGINELKARYAISKQRGENFHQGDEAIFDLFLANQPEQALTLALANWQIQREPKDALIVMQAALAANNPLAAKSVIDWVRQTGLEYLTLNKLLANVNAINP